MASGAEEEESVGEGEEEGMGDPWLPTPSGIGEGLLLAGLLLAGLKAPDSTCPTTN